MSMVDNKGLASEVVETIAAWMLGLLWMLPLLFAIWTAIHPSAYVAKFDLLAPITAQNFVTAWEAAPFARYFLNTMLLVTGILLAQFVLCTLAAFAFARFEFKGRDTLFMLVLVQLMVAPDVLLLENYITIRQLGLVDTLPAIALPYLASAFCCGRRSRLYRKTLKRRHGSRGAQRWASSGAFMYRWASPSTSPMGWCWSAFIGTISCGP